MPRKKTAHINIEETHTKDNEFVYCSLRKCPHTECLRHNVNAPWWTLILVRKFAPDGQWHCKDIVMERGEKD